MTYKLRDAKVVEQYPTPSGGMQKEEYYQTLKFSAEQLPELMLWKPGEDYLIVLKVRQTKYELEKDKSGAEECGYFEVRAVGALEPEYATAMTMAANKLNIKS